MQKTIVGDWGSELNDGDYACALAALGVLQSTGTMQHYYSDDLVSALQQEFVDGERTPLWRGAFGSDLDTTLESWRETPNIPAAELADAWRKYRKSIPAGKERQQPRLAIELHWRKRTDLFDFNDLCAWLNHDDVGLETLVLAERGKDDLIARWHWPVQVGVPLGTDERIFAALQAAQNDVSWVKSLSQFYAVGGSRDWCDLLLLTPDAADQILHQHRTHIRASFVACLWGPPGSCSDLPENYGALRNRLRAVGMAVVGRPDNFADLSGWFTSVVHDLSHDVPIHGAVSSATRYRRKRNAMTLGDPRALDACRILGLAKRQDHLAGLLAKEAGIDELRLPEAAGGEPVFRGVPPESPAPPPPPSLPDRLKRSLADDFRKREFTAEDKDGEQSVNDLNEGKEEIDRLRRPRWIQATAWRPDAPERQAQSLASERWNLLKVHIGPTEVQRSDLPFPEGSVDFSRGDVTISVQVELSGAELSSIKVTPREWNTLSNDRGRGKAMEGLFKSLPTSPATEDPTAAVAASSTINLPEIGDSSPALFAVRPQSRVREVAGRISIIHNNRLLQTAKVSFPTDNAMRSARGISVVAEAPIHPNDDDLEKRREYDVVIQVSDLGGKLHLTINQDGENTTVQLDDLSSPINLIRKALHQTTVTWDGSESMLTHENFRINLYSLAANGSAIEQHLRKHCGEKIKNWQRIHIVPATNTFLPLEYVYSGPPPRPKAKLCPNMLGALERGKCEAAVETPSGFEACPNREDKLFTCPMHFWGFRNLIERSSTIRVASTPGGTSPQKITVPSKNPYGKIRGMLFAASNKAFKYKNDEEARQAEREGLVTALGAISTVSDAVDWDDWCKKVVTKPNLLLLIVHSEQFQGAPALEIGDQEFLGYQEISEDLSGTDSQPQLLVLLGCSAASVSENFQTYPERFCDAGVKIVLAPVATIRGADAVPIAKRITQIIADCVAKSKPTAFGDFLPVLRRELLRDGHPGVMSIVGFGDGDWLLGGE